MKERADVPTKTSIVPEMCKGCGWVIGNECRTILEPLYLHEKNGCCFARTTPEKAKEIENEIKERRIEVLAYGKEVLAYGKKEAYKKA